jgi:hypothetical protein
MPSKIESRASRYQDVRWGTFYKCGRLLAEQAEERGWKGKATHIQCVIGNIFHDWMQRGGDLECLVQSCDEVIFDQGSEVFLINSFNGWLETPFGFCVIDLSCFIIF